MLQEKASNFKKYLEAHVKEGTNVRAFLDKYDEANLKPLIFTYLMPLYLTNQLQIAVDGVSEAFDNQDKEFLDKVRRYFECFCELVQVNE